MIGAEEKAIIIILCSLWTIGMDNLSGTLIKFREINQWLSCLIWNRTLGTCFFLLWEATLGIHLTVNKVRQVGPPPLLADHREGCAALLQRPEMEMCLLSEAVWTKPESEPGSLPRSSLNMPLRNLASLSSSLVNFVYIMCNLIPLFGRGGIFLNGANAFQTVSSYSTYSVEGEKKRKKKQIFF